MEFKQISGEEFVDLTGLKVKKVNKERKVFGKVIFHQFFDDSVTLAVEAYVKQGGEYRLMPFKPQAQGVCSYTKHHKQYYDEVVEYSDFPDPAPCPFGNVC